MFYNYDMNILLGVDVLNIHIYTWNLFCPLFWGETTLQKKAFSNQNRGHLGSRHIYELVVLNVFGIFIPTWGNDPILGSKFHQLGCSNM